MQTETAALFSEEVVAAAAADTQLSNDVEVEETRVTPPKKLALPQKYVRAKVFFYWSLKNMKNEGILSEEQFSQLVTNYKFYDNIESQMQFFKEFDNIYKTEAKELKKDMKQHCNAQPPAQKRKYTRKTKPNVVDASTATDTTVEIEENDDSMFNIPVLEELERPNTPILNDTTMPTYEDFVEPTSHYTPNTPETEMVVDVVPVTTTEPEIVEIVVPAAAPITTTETEVVPAPATAPVAIATSSKETEKQKRPKKEPSEKKESKKKAATSNESTSSKKESQKKKPEKVPEKNDEDEAEINVHKVRIQGVLYLMDSNDVLYNAETHEEIGKYDKERRMIIEIDDDDEN